MKYLEIWTEELPRGWEWDPENPLGGTTEFYINIARALSDDLEVIVYYDGPAKFLDRVYYLPRSRFVGEEVVISCNSKAPRRGKHNIYWTSWYKAREADYLEFDERIVLSQYHQNVFGENSRIVPLSCWPLDLQGGVKVQGQCLYSSSPDRGLDYLHSIWPEVAARTGAKLISTYDKGISESRMCELYRTSQFWLHPGQGVELFCISAVKAQVAGCIPVVVPNMALAETVKTGVKVSLEEYKEALISAIEHPPVCLEVDFGTWRTVADDLLRNVRI